MPSFEKDPNAVLDYTFDWSRWLKTGESITSRMVIVESGLTKDSDSNTSTTVTVWLSGGSTNVNYGVTCRINTDQGRTDDRTLTIKVRER